MIEYFLSMCETKEQHLTIGLLITKDIFSWFFNYKIQEFYKNILFMLDLSELALVENETLPCVQYSTHY